jgi:hypothetical protein
MADNSEFQRLLSEAPMASNADTVTVVGILARTGDAERFVLTLAGGRSVTLDVDAVKSAKKIAGAIGQAMVQLELDAKKAPENVREFRPELNYKIPAAETHPAIAELSTFIADQGHTGVPDTVQTGPFDPSVGTGVFDPTGTGPFDTMGGGVNTSFYADTGQSTPFVATAPHQADPRAMMALSNIGGGRRTYWGPYDWSYDHTLQKPLYDPATA